MSKVFVLFTVGTIASRYDPATGGHIASLGAADVLRQVPGLDAVADLEVVDWGRVPASQFTFDQIIELGGLLQAALDRNDIDGAVLVQGTDSIEETSFALDLLTESPKPVVVVGAMRSSDEDGFDGATNLRQAVRCAGTGQLRDQGVVVVMAGQIHGGDDVVKSNTQAYTTFQSPNLGPLGAVDDRGIVLRRVRGPRPTVRTTVAAEPVFLVPSVVGADGSLIRAATTLGARGLVIAGAGTGNTPVDMLEASRDAMSAGAVVVLATRCFSGAVSPLYSFPGAGATWADAGAILAGFLAAPKARLALALGLGSGLDRAELLDLFATWSPVAR